MRPYCKVLTIFLIWKYNETEFTIDLNSSGCAKQCFVISKNGLGIHMIDNQWHGTTAKEVYVLNLSPSNSHMDIHFEVFIPHSHSLFY